MVGGRLSTLAATTAWLTRTVAVPSAFTDRPAERAASPTASTSTVTVADPLPDVAPTTRIQLSPPAMLQAQSAAGGVMVKV